MKCFTSRQARGAVRCRLAAIDCSKAVLELSSLCEVWWTDSSSIRRGFMAVVSQEPLREGAWQALGRLDGVPLREQPVMPGWRVRCPALEPTPMCLPT